MIQDAKSVLIRIFAQARQERCNMGKAKNTAPQRLPSDIGRRRGGTVRSGDHAHQ